MICCASRYVFNLCPTQLKNRKRASRRPRKTHKCLPNWSVTLWRGEKIRVTLAFCCSKHTHTHARAHTHTHSLSPSLFLRPPFRGELSHVRNHSATYRYKTNYYVSKVRVKLIYIYIYRRRRYVHIDPTFEKKDRRILFFLFFSFLFFFFFFLI